ncbi:ATP-binding protein [Roseovarius arcticus]|uniref:ATP-binding protein n=1 Tax=Roseovarius arcticus TaxID=2547404 RepID=UPI0011100214|nr:ATP-binding protein [Roseovarius arcticus]
MNSIRIRLFIVLVVATGIVWLSAFAWVQQSTRTKVERVLDARLAEAGQMVSSLISDQRIDVARTASAFADAATGDALRSSGYSHKLSCQIWSLDGALVGSSQSAPTERLTNQNTGFSSSVVDGERWRVYSVVNEALGMRIMVGDSYTVRDRLVTDVTKGLALPALLMFPIMASLILLSVQRGLAPLERMAAALSQRPADDLSPVVVAPLPREIKPMGDALNGLFSRVDAMRDREKTFTSFAAHELKTPLAGIKTQAQVAEMATDPEMRTQALQRIQFGVERADRMVRQLLALASLDRHSAGTERAADARSVVEAVASDLKRLADDKNVSIQIDWRSDVRTQVNSILLTAALRNVLENAVIVSPNGAEVKIIFTAEENRLLVAVLDRGSGIPEDDRVRITDRFYRGKDAKEGGSGLGLSIVATAMQRLGGTVSFQTRPGGGEIVTLAFATA